MIYDEPPSGPLPHLGLPLESLEEMAARMVHRPTPDVADAIVSAVNRRTRESRHEVGTSRVKANLWRAGIDVTVEQVAWVIVTMMRTEGQ